MQKNELSLVLKGYQNMLTSPIYSNIENMALNNLQWLNMSKNKKKQKKNKKKKQIIIYLICMYKDNLALSNLQWLIWHKTQPNQTKYINYIYSVSQK